MHSRIAKTMLNLLPITETCGMTVNWNRHHCNTWSSIRMATKTSKIWKVRATHSISNDTVTDKDDTVTHKNDTVTHKLKCCSLICVWIPVPNDLICCWWCIDIHNEFWCCIMHSIQSVPYLEHFDEAPSRSKHFSLYHSNI